jgi:very-short-patch-repair endonuclease
MKAGNSITKRRKGATERARRLRRDETDAERRLWYWLSGRELCGFKFVRQIPLGPYVVDFLCRSKRLVIEIDGEQHADSVGDVRRTAWLNRHGYSVLRFWNHEVLRERDSVLDAVLAVLSGDIAAPSPGLRFAPADLSPAGRGGEAGISDGPATASIQEPAPALERRPLHRGGSSGPAMPAGRRQ